MPRGSKTSYSSKQKRMAEHIEEGYKEKGASGKKAGRIAWATVNKMDGGAKGRGATKAKKSKTMGKRKVAGRKPIHSRKAA